MARSSLGFDKTLRNSLFCPDRQSVKDRGTDPDGTPAHNCRLFKTAAIVSHGRYVAFQMATQASPSEESNDQTEDCTNNSPSILTHSFASLP
jgi:hypothetical protein